MRKFALYNGNIHTLDDARPRAEALGIADGRVAAVGTRDEVRDAIGASDGVDLRGRTVVPGLIDAHLHFLGLSRALREVHLTGARSIAEVVDRVAARAAEMPPDQWITGGGWNVNTLRDGRWPTRVDLDLRVTAHPVAISSQDHHSALVNTRALEAAGIGRDTPDPPDGRIERDEHGEPTGLLIEGAQGYLRRVIPEPIEADIDEALRAGMREANRLGLTGAHSMEHPQAFAALQRLHARGELTIRIYESIPADLLDHASALGIRTGFGNEWLRLGHLKIFADGALGSRSALMLAPYEGEPENYGIGVRPPEELRDLIRHAGAAGIATCIHAIGDAANRLILDIYEEARRDGLLDGLRPRIEHAQVLDPADFDRFARIGVIPSMQPIHCTSDMVGIDKWWGARGRGAYIFETLRKSGATLAFGSDAPVDDLSPIAGIHAAVTRQSPQHEPAGGWYPEERLSAEDALRAYTTGAAYASGEEALKGTLSAGKLGDLVVLSQDILAVPGPEILNTRVELTVVGGEVVYSA
ncbi:MAG TPA: amidohydrolase [Thermomicrobiales bacterium]|nr:amidohydrolase [Thermomicrobiales bacterium]